MGILLAQENFFVVMMDAVHHGYWKAEDFAEKLKPLYAGMPEKYQYIEYPDLAHAVPMIMKERVVEWMKIHL